MSRFREDRAFRPTSGNAGGSAVYGDLAQRLGSFANTLQEEHRAQRIRDAQADAAKADPRKLELKNNDTVYGEEYNRRLMAAHQAAIKIDMSNKLEQFALEHPDNPELFAQKAEAVRSQLVDGAAPEVKQYAGLNYDNLANSYLNRIKATHKRNTEAAALAETQDALKTSANDILRMVRNGDDKSAAEEFQALSVTMDGLDIPDHEKTQFLSDVKRGMLEQTYLDEIEDLPPAAALAKVEKWAKEIPASHDPQQWDRFISSSRALVARNKGIQDGQKAVATHEDRRVVRDYIKAVQLGYQVSEAEKRAAHAAGLRTESARDIADAEDVSAFSLLPAHQRVGAIEAVTGLENVGLYEQMSTAHRAIQKAAEVDGLSLATQQGLIELPPLELSKDGMRERVKVAAAAAAHYGVPVSPLTDQEASALTQQLDTMTPREKTSMAVALSEAPEVWQQIAKKGAGAFAMAGATQAPDVMDAVFKGQQMLAEKVSAAPKPSEYLPVFQDATEDVYPAKEASALMQAALAHYASTSVGEFDANAFRESIEAVSGGIAKINGYKLELPRGVSEDEFDDFIDRFSPAAVTHFGGVANHTAEQAAHKIQRSRIRSIGNNRYIVENNGLALFKPDGTPFVIQYSTDLPLAARPAIVPELQSGL